MAITRFRPEVWSARLLVATRTRLVYAQPGVVNRDYEGEIADSGDTVRITSISDPTIGTYTPNSTVITPEELTDAQRTLTVDQSKYFAFKVDDVDKRQAKGNVMPEAMSRAAYGLARVADSHVASLYTQAAAANQLGTVSVTTAALAYTQIRLMKLKMDEADIPEEGRYLVGPPWFFSLLLEDNKFLDASASGSTQPLQNGFIGRALGFNLAQSNAAPNPTGDDFVVQAGVPQAISYAEQINKTEAYKPESSFSDAIKGLHLYGAKVIRPSHLVTLLASKT
ncbi:MULTISPECIES: P22 coat protein - protein 5 domain protein [unclassified Streptomyces]|uniref:phage major capsid protein n=1 Tax=unclassified Streptomyces TaxID=2593676 RepID=UPI00364C558C